MGIGVGVGVRVVPTVVPTVGVAVAVVVVANVGVGVAVDMGVASGWVQAASSPKPTSTMVSHRISMGPILAAAASGLATASSQRP